MPHFTIEYSPNIESIVDMDELVETVRETAASTGVFPIGGIRVRAVRCEHYAIGDGRDGLAFIDVLLRIGDGRDLETRKRAGQAIFDALSSHLDPVFATTPLALSLDIQINDKATSWKRNTIHDHIAPERKL